MPQQEISSEEMFGISKRVNKELEQFPMHTHSAICEMIRVGMQHRNLSMQNADRIEANERQDRQLKVQEFHMQQAQKQAEAGPALVNGGKPNSPGPN